MDTGTHLLMGVTLGGLALALADPALLSHSNAAFGLFAATIAGSNAPDFDTVVRLRGYKSYLRHHRGFSHSLPMLLGWPILLAPATALAFHAWAYLIPLFLWTTAGVLLHVFLDYFNAYGVQCFRPVSRKWFHADAIPIFDPVLFVLHAAGLALWLSGLWGPAVFLPVYAATFLFIACRILLGRLTLRRVRLRYGPDGYAFLIPGALPHQWKYVHETGRLYITGTAYGRSLQEEAVFEKGEENDAVRAAMGLDGVRAFLRFTHRVHISCHKLQDGYKVELRDVRFRHGQLLPFGMDVVLDERLQAISDSIGWRKKLWEPPYV